MITQMNLKQMFLGTITAGATTVYSVNSSVSSAVIKELVAYNNGTEPVDFQLAINDIQLIGQTIDAGDSLFSDKTWYLVFKPGDVVTITTDKDNVNVLIVGAETVAASN